MMMVITALFLFQATLVSGEATSYLSLTKCYEFMYKRGLVRVYVLFTLPIVVKAHDRPTF